jgi:alpha-aminoadipic semialdehyde synthase
LIYPEDGRGHGGKWGIRVSCRQTKGGSFLSTRDKGDVPVRNCIGIRRETKDETQRRAPLSPQQVSELVHRHKITVIVEPWKNRVFKDEEYEKAGAVLSTDLRRSNIIFGVKEIARRYLYDDHQYCFFSHTVKGQPGNMPMLKRIIDRRNTLFDYELVRDDNGRRLILFGDYAGYAGMIDSMWAFGKRLFWEGIKNPFTEIEYATNYQGLSAAEQAFRSLGDKIQAEGLPKSIVPFVCGFTGYGHVSKAAQHLYDLLPTEELEPDALSGFFDKRKFSDNVAYKVQFRKPDMFKHKNRSLFDAKEFKEHPERFSNRFESYVPYLSMIINGIYWEPKFPRLLTREFARTFYKNNPKPRLRVIGDITCDLEGSIELTVKITDSRNPVYVYQPLADDVKDGWEGNGPVILAVDKLPTELPQEASEAFGQTLLPFVPRLAEADYQQSFEMLTIPREFRKAVIVHRGRLTPEFKYLQQFLELT